jgi:hypothetical protein
LHVVYLGEFAHGLVPHSLEGKAPIWMLEADRDVFSPKWIQLPWEMQFNISKTDYLVLKVCDMTIKEYF